MKQKFAFTLAEVMIVLAVIGVLSAVLIPTAMRSKPDEDIMRFKNAHNTFYSVIRELVTSDKYYLDGDLGMKASGVQTNRYNDDPIEASGYFCATFGDVINAKSVSCSSVDTSSRHGHTIWSNICEGASDMTSRRACNGNRPRTTEEMQSSKKGIDTACKKVTDLTDYSYYVTNNDITYWELNSFQSFGIVTFYADGNLRTYSSPHEKPTYYDSFGMDVAYKGFCMDIDGINTGEDPFGYAVRADGKILNGARVDEWLEK